MSGFWTLVKRDLLLAVREGGATGTALGFYLIVIAIMPLGIGPDMQLLSRIAPGVLWIGLLLATLLSLGRMFEADQEEGVLDILATGRLPLEFVAAAKALAHWISSCLPLAILSPLLGLLLNLELAAYPILIGTVLVGSPAISLLGGIGAALTLRSRRGGLLIALLVLPLYIPTLIFGIAAISAVVNPPGSMEASLLLLAASTIVSLVVGPIATAAALRAQLG